MVRSVLVVADPVATFHPERETTTHLVRALIARSIEVYLSEPGGIGLQGGRVIVRARRVRSLTGPPFSYELDTAAQVPVADVGLVFIRHDPPVDDRFRAPLEVLRLVSQQVRCVNDPGSILQWTEKILPLRWPHLTPDTFIVGDIADALDAVSRLETAIVKPLHRCGGSGIFLLKRGDSNVAPILEECFRSEPRLVVQEYLPGSRDGDARILTIGEHVLGGFLRIPAAGSHRGNLHCAATLAPWRVPADVRTRLAPVLHALNQDGIRFAGIDWIDGKLTEINITSPMGLHELDATGFRVDHGASAADVVVDCCLTGVFPDAEPAPAHS